MKACVLPSSAPIETNPLRYGDVPAPEQLDPGQVLVRVHACGVCRTDLHVIEGELAPRKSPVIPGHQVVGVVERVGERVAGGGTQLRAGDRVGIPWLHQTDGTMPASGFVAVSARSIAPNAKAAKGTSESRLPLR